MSCPGLVHGVQLAEHQPKMAAKERKHTIFQGTCHLDWNKNPIVGVKDP